MEKDTFQSYLKEEIKNLRYNFTETDSEFCLTLNDKKIKFLKTSEINSFSPNRWLRAVHQNGKIHEPGLIATFFLLRKILEKESVIFYDIGALFGYHSFIFFSIFNESQVIAIEGNPISAEYIEINSKENDRFKVVNRVMGLDTKLSGFFINGFNFKECNQLKSYFLGFKLFLKNKIKITLNTFLRKNFILQNWKFLRLKSINIPTIFDFNTENKREIIKIDTEGYQAIFLPPFVENICERKAIVLMELDSPDKISQFGTSNNNLIQNFLENKYSAYWLDHRLGNEILKINKINKKQDKNSLVILFPEDFLDP